MSRMTENVALEPLSAGVPLTHKLKGWAKNHFTARATAGYVFVAGNLTYLATHLDKMKGPEGAVSALLIGAGVFFSHSKNRPQFLYPANGGVIAAQSIINATTPAGPGQMATRIGTLLPIFQSSLQMRAAHNQIHDRPPFQASSAWGKPLEFVDRYPFVASGLIQMPGAIATSIGSGINAHASSGAQATHEAGLGAAAALWALANVFVIASDPRVHEVTGKIRRGLGKAGGAILHVADQLAQELD